MDPELIARGDALCEELAKGHYENFTVGSWFLPKAMRRDFYAVYAFCRRTDDLGDEAEGDRLALLDQWEKDVRTCWKGTPTDPMLASLQRTVQDRDMVMEPFLKLIEANRMDQRQNRWATWKDLKEYCAHSADPVGRMVLGLFKQDNPTPRALSDFICTGLQLANHWQDVGKDAKNDRIYLPLADMKKFHVTEKQVLSLRPSPEFIELMKFEVARARELFVQGEPLIDLVDGALRRDVKLFIGGGRAILDAIEKQDFETLTKRPRVGKMKKASLVMKALVS